MANSQYLPDLSALISLLDDPDMEAFKQVCDKITSMGPEAVPPLEAAWEHAYTPVMQRRIEELVHQIQFRQLLTEFSGWLDSGGKDLFAGYALITRYQYPDLNMEKIRVLFDHIVRDIWLELNPNLTALEQVKVFNHMMFLVYKFGGISSGKPAPENYYLNILLESRQGTSLSMGMLYLIAGQKLELPLQGIDLPNHFVVAYTNMPSDNKNSGIDAIEVRFYINPFARGAVFSSKELNEYIKQLGVEPEKKFYYPCNNYQIIRRLVIELGESYSNAGNEEKAHEMGEFLVLLNKHSS